MEYKRLTIPKQKGASFRCVALEKGAIADAYDLVIDEKCDKVEEILERLAELEDKIENGTLIELPCIRKINSPLGAYEAVYINERDLMQECVVCTDKEGWLIVEKYGCPKHSEMAEQHLKELRREV